MQQQNILLDTVTPNSNLWRGNPKQRLVIIDGALKLNDKAYQNSLMQATAAGIFKFINL